MIALCVIITLCVMITQSVMNVRWMCDECVMNVWSICWA